MYLKDYHTKDTRVSSIVQKIKNAYGQIEGIRGKAQYLSNPTPVTGSMFAGLGSGGSGSGAGDEMGKSFLSDIKNFFGSISYKGAIGNSQMTQ